MSESAAQTEVVLLDGRRIFIRPVVPSDELLIAEAIRTSSTRTRLHRFFVPLSGLAPEELRRMLIIDPAREFCVAGELREESVRIVCGARYVRLTDPAKAEIALTVHDEFQGRGIGRVLMKLLIAQGKRDGVKTFVADVLATNDPMLHLLRFVAPKRRSMFAEGVTHVEFDLADTTG